MTRFHIALVAVAAVLFAPLVSAAETPMTLGQAEAALDLALQEDHRDYTERLAVVAQVDALLARTDPQPRLAAKARLVEAVAYLRLGEFDRSRAVLDPLCPGLNRVELPELRFRCLSMQAILLLVDGDRAGSLAGFQALFGGDLTDISEGLQNRANISYAAVLNENGRSDEAADLYERLMVKALAGGDDWLTLLSGNNLMVILINQGDYLAARETLNELQSVLARNPNSLVGTSLRLHDLELSRVEGDVERAISGLQAFIRDGEDTTPLMLGTAHKLLADALRDDDQLAEAQPHAAKAISLLSRQAHERSDAHLSMAQIRLKQRDYPGVLREVEQIDLSQEPVPARQMLVHRLRLQALLSMGGDADQIAALNAYINADAQRDLLASTTRSDYFEARLVAARRGLEVRQAEALAEAAVQQRLVDARNRNLWLGAMAVAAVALCLLVFLQLKRQGERRLLAAQQRQNDELECLVEDKTRELKANLNARAEMARALERGKRTEAIGQLAGNVAHDFNNLLQVIASGNETLGDPDASPAEKSKVLALSEKSLGHAAQIIRQLLAYARQQDLAPSPMRLRDFLEETEALLHSALGERNHLTIEDDSHGANILVDRTQLTTSLLNLIRNAADAMPTGGQVRISTQVRTLDDAAARSWNDVAPGDYLVVGVQDDGIGMSAQQVGSACEPFFSTKGPQSGTGLGLSSVYGFVKQSGGDLKIHSAPDEGTLVQFLLPVTQEPVQVQAPAKPGSNKALAGQRVLLVEDNHAVARMLESVLKQAQLRTVRVASGQEAQDYLQGDTDFDFVLSDVRMPGVLDGPALARWIQKEIPKLKVLLMSGYSEMAAADLDLPLIRKPFKVSQLTRFLAEHGEITQEEDEVV